MRTSAQGIVQRVFYRDDLVGADNYQPNDPVNVSRYVRITPLAGAALYPVVCKLQARGKTENFYGPSWHDLGSDERLVVQPRKFSDAFAPSPMVASHGTAQVQAPAPIATPPPPKKGWPVPPIGEIGLSGYISGQYLIESTDDVEAVRIAQSSPAPAAPWLAAYRQTLLLTPATFANLIAAAPPYYVPDYSPGPVDPLLFDQNFDGIFLGCGARVVRYSFFDVPGGSPFPAVIRKYILGPFSQKPEEFGSITIDTARQMTFDETINLNIPMWLYLVRDGSGAGGYGVTVHVSRQP